VEVVLREITTAGESSTLLNTGLRGFGLERGASTDGVPLASDNLPFDNVTPNVGDGQGQFQFAGSTSDSDMAALNFVGATTGSEAGVDGANNPVFELLLGTVDLLGPNAFQSTTFTLADSNINTDQFVLATGGSLDSQINYGNTLTITAIPEPSSVFALAALTGTVVMTSRRRRRS
jgi:hypothetical protein